MRFRQSDALGRGVRAESTVHQTEKTRAICESPLQEGRDIMDLAGIDQVFYQNLSTVRREKKIKMGEIELACDVQLGYFASCANQRIANTIRLRHAAAAAQFLGVSLDELCSLEFSRETELKQLLAEARKIVKKLEALTGELDVETQILHGRAEVQAL